MLVLQLMGNSVDTFLWFVMCFNLYLIVCLLFVGYFVCLLVDFGCLFWLFVFVVWCYCGF